jgi:hypothetical protein
MDFSFALLSYFLCRSFVADVCVSVYVCCDWSFALSFKTTVAILLEFNDAKGLEQLIALRVVELMVDEKSGFNAFALRHQTNASIGASGGAATTGSALSPRQRWAQQLKQFQSDLVAVLLNVYKQYDTSVGWRVMGLTQTVYSPYEFDERDRDGAEDGDFTRFVNVLEYDVRTERAYQPMETDGVLAHLKYCPAFPSLCCVCCVGCVLL